MSMARSIRRIRLIGNRKDGVLGEMGEFRMLILEGFPEVWFMSLFRPITHRTQLTDLCMSAITRI